MKMLRLILPLFLFLGGAAFAQQGGGVVGKPPFTGCATWSSTNILTGTGAACVGGTVTSVSVTTANGVSGSVATATTTPAITLTLGAITPSTVTTGGNITLPATATLVFSGRAAIESDAVNNLTLYGNSGGALGLLAFGGTSSSFPAIKRSTTELQVKLADDSAFTRFTAGSFKFGIGTLLQAGADGNMQITDSTAATVGHIYLGPATGSGVALSVGGGPTILFQRGDLGGEAIIEAYSYRANGSAGVSCGPASPTAAFQVAGGIVIAC